VGEMTGNFPRCRRVGGIGMEVVLVVLVSWWSRWAGSERMAVAVRVAKRD